MTYSYPHMRDRGLLVPVRLTQLTDDAGEVA